jgi:5-hydroxyisourate hydrolase
MTISTHVLDTSIGRPAAAVDVRLYAQQTDGRRQEIGRATTSADGRVSGFPAAAPLERAGMYALQFDVGAYFRGRGVDSFYQLVTVDFVAADPAAHYHVPLLLSPYGYSTYRGS